MKVTASASALRDRALRAPPDLGEPPCGVASCEVGAPREAHGVVHDDGLAALKRAERHLAKHGERV